MRRATRAGAPRRIEHGPKDPVDDHKKPRALLRLMRLRTPARS